MCLKTFLKFRLRNEIVKNNLALPRDQEPIIGGKAFGTVEQNSKKHFTKFNKNEKVIPPYKRKLTIYIIVMYTSIFII